MIDKLMNWIKFSFSNFHPFSNRYNNRKREEKKKHKTLYQEGDSRVIVIIRNVFMGVAPAPYDFVLMFEFKKKGSKKNHTMHFYFMQFFLKGYNSSFPA